MEGYKQRFVNEYRELSGRRKRLASMITGYELGTLDFEPDCPISLLSDQLEAMDRYSEILEARAAIEGILLDLIKTPNATT